MVERKKINLNLKILDLSNELFSVKWTLKNRVTVEHTMILPCLYIASNKNEVKNTLKSINSLNGQLKPTKILTDSA